MLPHRNEIITRSTNVLDRGTKTSFELEATSSELPRQQTFANLPPEGPNSGYLPRQNIVPLTRGSDATVPAEQGQSRVPPHMSVLHSTQIVARQPVPGQQEVLELDAEQTPDRVRQADNSDDSLRRNEQDHGLHLTYLENIPNPPRVIEDVYSLHGETEIFNEGPEPVGGVPQRFYRCVSLRGLYGVLAAKLSRDILSSNGTAFVSSRLRLFRTQDGRIHIHTERQGGGIYDFYGKNRNLYMQ
jgi:hypothetical protein